MSVPTLRALLSDKSSVAVIARHLDALEPAERLAQALDLGRADQAALFELGADLPPIRLSHFVPDDVPPAVALHHVGRNTIPVPRYFQGFEKRFAKIPGDDDEIAGYNESAAWFVSPGYFVAMETDVRPDWRPHGGVVIDYFRVPEPGVVLPPGWPRVVPNSVGLQRLVYHETRDYMRKVSGHVSIGRAAKDDKLLDFWFVLCREDVETRAGDDEDDRGDDDGGDDDE